MRGGYIPEARARVRSAVVSKTRRLDRRALIERGSQTGIEGVPESACEEKKVKSSLGGD